MPQKISREALSQFQEVGAGDAGNGDSDRGVIGGAANSITDALMGIIKGGADTATSVAGMIPFVSDAAADVGNDLGGLAARVMHGKEAVTPKRFTTADTKTALQPKNTAESVGKGAEQIGEFFVPAGMARDAAIKGLVRLIPDAASPGTMKMLNKAGAIIGRTAGEAGSAAAVGALHGDKNVDDEALLAGAGPVVGASLEALAPLIRNPLVARVLPYLAASAGSSMLGGITPAGVGAGLSGFGLMQSLTKSAIRDPKVVQKLQKLLRVGSMGVGRAAAAGKSVYDTSNTDDYSVE